jgi:surface polysaccharide O-acyltransferase-like enzyme
LGGKVTAGASAHAAAKAPRDAGIELGRIFCCYCVILIHLAAFEFEGFNFNRALFADNPWVNLVWSVAKCAATPVFFLIAGYFFNEEKPFSMYMLRIAARVFAPLICVMLLIAQLTPWLSGRGAFGDCFGGLNFYNFKMVFQILITQWPYQYIDGYDPFISLWFTFALLLCYLCIPLLKVICAENPVSRKLKMYLLGLGAFFFVFRVSLVTFFPDSFFFQHLDWWIEEKPFYWLWIMLIGHELHRVFRDKELLDKWRARLASYGLAAFILGGVALYCLSLAFGVGPGGSVSQRFFVREFVVYFLAQLGMFVFFLSLNPGRGLLSRAILFVADKTFYVFILHEAVYHKLLQVTGLDMTRLGDYLALSVITFAAALVIGTACKKIEKAVASRLSRGWARLRKGPEPQSAA